jgi:hypothetical protein
MYRSIFLITLFLSNALLSSAQEEETVTRRNKMFIGIQAGSVVRIPFTLYDGVDYKKEQLPDCTFGLSFQHNFSKRFSFRAELNYEKVRYRNTYNKIDTIIVSYIKAPTGAPLIAPYKSVYCYEYISAPVLIKFNIIAQDKNLLFIDAGTCGTYVFRSYERIYSESFNYSHKYRHKAYAGSFNIDAFAGIGYDRKLDSRMHLTIEARDHFTTEDHIWRFFVGFSYRL